MKTLLQIIAAVTAALTSAYPQGSIDFRNMNLSSPPDRLVRVGLFVPPPGGTGPNQNELGTGLVGTQFVAQLFYWSEAPDAFCNVDASPAVMNTNVSRFRSSTTSLPGTWSGGARTFRATALGETTKLVVRVWDGTYGSYGDAYRASGLYAQSAPFTYTTPSTTTPPPDQLFMHNFEGFTFPVSITSTCSVGVAGVLTGPVTNTANSHIYYLLNQNTWLESQIQAVALGGNLATINDAAEQEWLFRTFTVSGTPRGFWIGLNDLGHEGMFSWVSGSTATYSNWWPGQPNNNGPQGESYVHMWAEGFVESVLPGFWNDLPEVMTYADFALHGIVETEPSENLVVKGGFEIPSIFAGAQHVAANTLAPWQTTEDSFELWFTGIEMRSADGLLNLEILSQDTSATIWQDVPTIPGEDYTLSFRHTPRPGIDSTLTVSIGSHVVATLVENGSSLNHYDWKLFSTNFTATASTMRIAFSDAAGSDAGTHIDRVMVSRSPPKAEIRVSEVEVCWETVATKTYQVHYRSSRTTNVWTPLLPPMQGDGNRNCIKDAVAVGEPQRFYRIFAMP